MGSIREPSSDHEGELMRRRLGKGRLETEKQAECYRGKGRGGEALLVNSLFTIR